MNEEKINFTTLLAREHAAEILHAFADSLVEGQIDICHNNDVMQIFPQESVKVAVCAEKNENDKEQNEIFTLQISWNKLK